MLRRVGFGVVVILAALLVWRLWPAPVLPDPTPERSPTARPPPPDSAALEPIPPATPERPEGFTLVLPDADDRPVDVERATAGGVRMPLVDKLTREPLSDVEHQVVGAWDDQPTSPDLGAHRTFVTLVDPELPTRELESLIRDIAQSHRGAEVLDVRVYDSPDAVVANPNLDGGAALQRHLVARVVRNDRLEYERMTVRGETILP